LEYKLKRCSKKYGVNNVDMSSSSSPWQNGRYKKQHTEQPPKHAEHYDATDIKKKLVIVFFGFSFFLLFIIS